MGFTGNDSIPDFSRERCGKRAMSHTQGAIRAWAFGALILICQEMMYEYELITV
jgi:hypothetical protein